MSNAPKLKTRRPTGRAPWPMLLIAGVEKAGKSYSGALFSASDLIDRTFWIEIGEGAADQYGAIPGARYEIVEHDGSYQSIAGAVAAAAAEPRENGKPHAIVIDSMTELWDMLSDEAQLKANERARAKAAAERKPAPVGEAQITMDLWNLAKKRWRRILDALRVYDGPVILLTRLESVAVMDGNAPAKSGAREWKVRAEKNLPFEADAVVKMTAPQECFLTGVRSTVVQVPPGAQLPLPHFTIDGLLRQMGLDAPGATAPRSYIAPRPVVPDDEPAERPAQRERGQSEDEWAMPAPSPTLPTATGVQIAAIADLLKAKRTADQSAWNQIISNLLRRRIDDVRTISHAEARGLMETLSGEPDLGAQQPASGPTPNDPVAANGAQRMMHALFREKGIGDDDKHAFITRVLGGDIETMARITRSQCDAVIQALTTGEVPVHASLPEGIAPSDEGFDEFAALTQMIHDVHDEASFVEAQKAIDTERAAGSIDDDDVRLLRERLAEQAQAIPAGAAA